MAVAVAVAVAVAGFGTYTYLATHGPRTTLVVYTYPSLLGGGCGANGTAAAFAPFEAAHNVRFDLECPMGTLATTLINQANAPGADLVIGLDEVTAPQAAAAGVLVPYASPQLAHVPASLVTTLGAGANATPYEWGYLALDRCPGFPAGTAPFLPTFPELGANRTLASNLLIEDPSLDIVGEEFLLWEIAFYQGLLHADWTPWWSEVRGEAAYAPSWDTGFKEFTCGPGSRNLFVSYLTDPAYAAYAGAAGSLNASTVGWGGASYGWKTVYGIGIVKGTSHLALDEAFIDWFLGGPVQGFLPTSEWEYPANASVVVPPVFRWAPDPSTVVPLNGYLPPSTIVANLKSWVNTWVGINLGA